VGTRATELSKTAASGSSSRACHGGAKGMAWSVHSTPRQYAALRYPSARANGFRWVIQHASEPCRATPRTSTSESAERCMQHTPSMLPCARSTIRSVIRRKPPLDAPPGSGQPWTRGYSSSFFSLARSSGVTGQFSSSAAQPTRESLPVCKCRQYENSVAARGAAASFAHRYSSVRVGFARSEWRVNRFLSDWSGAVVCRAYRR
jgi:hypothetical protein